MKSQESIHRARQGQRSWSSATHGYPVIGCILLFLAAAARATPSNGNSFPSPHVVPEKAKIQNQKKKENGDAVASPLSCDASERVVTTERENPMDTTVVATTDEPKKEKKTKDKTVGKAKKAKKTKNTTASSKNPSFSQESATLRRIKREYKDVVNMGIAYDWSRGEPIKKPKKNKGLNETKSQEDLHICIGPLSTNIRHWHFSFVGPHIYESGMYHGRITLPKDYPDSPPKVQMWTPNGRFQTMKDICLSASNFHPESWTARWNIMALVQSLRIHMLENPQQIGGLTCSRDQILELARESRTWKKTFTSSGGQKITIDHSVLREQKLLSPKVDDEEDINNSSKESESIEAKEVSPKKSSKSAKKRREHSSKRKKQKMSKRRPSYSITEQKDNTIRMFLRVISSLISSPTRIAILSFLLFIWVVKFS